MKNNSLIKEYFAGNVIIGGKPEDVRPLQLTLLNIGVTQGRVLDLGAPETFVFFMIKEDSFIHGLSMAKTIADTSDQWKGVKGGAINHYRQIVKDFLAGIPEDRFYPKESFVDLGDSWMFEGNRFVDQEHPSERAEREDDVTNQGVFA